MAHVHIHLCPKCGGQKRVNKPPWVAGDQNTWVSNGTGSYECPVCSGKGYLILNESPHDRSPADFGSEDATADPGSPT